MQTHADKKNVPIENEFNSAMRHFTGEDTQGHDQRKYEEWYTCETLIYLANINNSKNVVTYIFLTQATETDEISFKRQYELLLDYKKSHSEIEKLCFIAHEPAKFATSHYIFGMLIDGALFFVNPLGKNKEDFYEYLAELNSLKLLPPIVYISSTVIQKDESTEVSCGPLCIQILKHFSEFDTALLCQKLEEQSKKQSLYNFDFLEVDVTDLLSSQLQELMKVDSGFKEKLIEIRNFHFDALTKLNDDECEKYQSSDVQAVVTKTILKGKSNRTQINKAIEFILRKMHEITSSTQADFTIQFRLALIGSTFLFLQSSYKEEFTFADENTLFSDSKDIQIKLNVDDNQEISSLLKEIYNCFLQFLKADNSHNLNVGEKFQSIRRQFPELQDFNSSEWAAAQLGKLNPILPSFAPASSEFTPSSIIPSSPRAMLQPALSKKPLTSQSMNSIDVDKKLNLILGWLKEIQQGLFKGKKNESYFEELLNNINNNVKELQKIESGTDRNLIVILREISYLTQLIANPTAEQDDRHFVDNFADRLDKLSIVIRGSAKEHEKDPVLAVLSGPACLSNIDLINRYAMVRWREPCVHCAHGDSHRGCLKKQELAALSKELNERGLKVIASPWAKKFIAVSGISRFNLIIGKNGVGKSRLLRQFCGCTEKWNARHLHIFADRGNVDTVIHHKRVKNRNISEDYKVQAKEKFEKLFYHIGHAALNLKNRTELLHKLQNNHYDFFAEEIKLFNDLIPTIRVSYEDKLKINDDKPSRAFKYMSSGEVELLTIAADIYHFVLIKQEEEGDHSYIMIDEPDLHLHTDAQERLFDFINKITVNTKIKVFICSHSLAILNKLVALSEESEKENNADCRVLFLTAALQDKDDIQFVKIDTQLGLILRNTGGNPITSIPRGGKYLLIEGDDERLLVDSLRRKEVVNFYPVSVGGVGSMFAYTRKMAQLSKSLLDRQEQLYLLMDSDKKTDRNKSEEKGRYKEEFGESVSVNFLNCAALENLIFTVEIMPILIMSSNKLAKERNQKERKEIIDGFLICIQEHLQKTSKRKQKTKQPNMRSTEEIRTMRAKGFRTNVLRVVDPGISWVEAISRGIKNFKQGVENSNCNSVGEIEYIVKRLRGLNFGEFGNFLGEDFICNILQMPFMQKVIPLATPIFLQGPQMILFPLPKIVHSAAAGTTAKNSSNDRSNGM